MAITVAKKAWMAGILDYRGRIVYKENKTRNHNNQVTLYVESIQLKVIERLAEMTGGSPEVKTRSRDRSQGWFRRGCDDHCPEAHFHVLPGDFADSARWTISGSAMSVVLMAVQPYMVQDRGITEGIAYGLEYMKLAGRGAAATVTALRRLHKLGWPMPPIIEETRPGLFARTPKRQEKVNADAQGWGTEEVVPQEPDLHLVPGA